MIRCPFRLNRYLTTAPKPHLHLHLLTPLPPSRPSFKTRYIVNNFFHAVATKNITDARTYLRHLKLKTTSQKSLPVYIACLDLFATYLQQAGPRLNLQDIKYIADEISSSNVAKSEKNDNTNTIASKLVNCLEQLRQLPRTSPALVSAIDEFAASINEKFQISPLPATETALVKGAVMNFKDLCDYISSTRFLKYGTEEPMYQIYQELSPAEKEQFMSEYLAHNTQRQLYVEAHCTSLVKRAVLKRNPHSLLIDMWTKELENAIAHSSDEVLHTYSGILELIPKPTICTVVVNTIHSLCVRADKGYAKLFRVVEKIVNSFNHLVISQPEFANFRKHFFTVFTKEDGIRLFSHLVKLAIENCTIPPQLVYKSFPKNTHYLLDSKGAFSKNQAFILLMIKSPDSTSYRQVGTIVPHPFLVYDFKGRQEMPETTSILLPMLVPARNWTSPDEGGYLGDLQPILHSDFTEKSLQYLRLANRTSQLQSTFKGLDYLGSQAWAVNLSMLEVFSSAMQRSDGMLNIVPPVSSMEVNIPPNPSRKDFGSETEYYIALKNVKKEREKRLQEFHNLKGLRVELETLLKAARAFGANGDMVYLPHQLDFRSRAYPMVSVLSHYQSDLVRSLLTFWHSKPLGPDGDKWLRYQLAAHYGMDKLSLDGRLKFVADNMETILKCAQNPFGEVWWQKAEKPWQTLAMCFEFAKLQKYIAEGKSVHDYPCRLPISLDGSCNGLQHYAALGADKLGAQSVNVMPSEKDNGVRQDVYSAVLEIVTQKVLKSEADEPNITSSLAKHLLSRKLIKQTVMTSVYGVTAFGAAAQIRNRISDVIDLADKLEPKIREEVKTHQNKIALYLSKMVLDSISELFSGARRLQDWLLLNCYRIISSWDEATLVSLESENIEVDFFLNKFYRPMMWTSVSGFPVVQIYLKPQRQILETSLQRFSLQKWTKPSPVDIQRQLNGVAPNFIHSLDSVHMFMTCLAAKAEDIAFVAVHDSFWTHSRDIERLSTIIREEFARLYSAPIVESLLEDMQNTVRNSYQLVWLENESNASLVRELVVLRGLKNRHTSSGTNRALRRELADNSQVEELLQKYKPKLYHQMAGKLMQYDDPTKVKNGSIGIKTWTPVFTRVRLLEAPQRGDLQIEDVIKSKYFFS